MADKQIFETCLEKHENMDATGIYVPFDVEKIFGAKRVPVKIRINGAEHLSTIIKMGGRYIIGVPKIFRAAAQIKAGETITVEIEKDTEKRTVEIPADLTEALAANDLTEVFANLSYTHRKEYVNAVSDSKKPETRTRRIEKTVGQLIGKRK